MSRVLREGGVAVRPVGYSSMHLLCSPGAMEGGLRILLLWGHGVRSAA